MSSRKAPPDILARIVEAERKVVEETRRSTSVEALRERPGYALQRRSLRASLESRSPAVISECKRRSPSKGVLRDPYDPVAIARSYEKAGAAAISVLTNGEFFGGSLDDLERVREVVDIPILRKEFVVDPFQIEEARAAGADAILLIVAVLDQSELVDLSQAAVDLGLEVLVEVHDDEEMDVALTAKPALLGVNNRDLRTFTTDLATTERLASRVPDGTLLVAESGIHSNADLARLERAGAGAFLVGEAFMKAPDPGAALRSLMGRAGGAA